ncbi:MAG: tRNA (adenosine(37)-N6)-threonylcarbamoyltransferase complex ATPase subunit type 1 TsaE [Bdellovibrionota bacterium]
MADKHFKDLTRRFREHAWKRPVLVLLEGDLGVGKTTFVKELFEGWGYPASKVQSPTFLKLIEHDVASQGLCLHMDCYRIEDVQDFDRLGLENYLDASFWFVEWPELFLSYLEERPSLKKLLGFTSRVRLGFEMTESGEREVSFEIDPLH